MRLRAVKPKKKRNVFLVNIQFLGARPYHGHSATTLSACALKESILFLALFGGCVLSWKTHPRTLKKIKIKIKNLKKGQNRSALLELCACSLLLVLCVAFFANLV